MSNIWKHIDESSELISTQYKLWGNYFKAHTLTFFSDKNGKEIVSNLQFCLLEITTLLDNDAIGEVYLFSNLGDSKALELIDKYKSIINEVKTQFLGKGISSFIDWYSRCTYIYIGENLNYEENVQNDFKWNFDGMSQKEKRERKKYACSSEKLEEKFVEEYLNYYIKKLNQCNGFLNHKHYAVIVKPIALKHEDEIIPIGNVYLHFGTSIEYTEDDYKKFINQFKNIYFHEKGGIVIKQIQYKTSLSLLKPFEPNFNFHVKEKHNFTRVQDRFIKFFDNNSNYKSFESGLIKLENEAKLLFNENGSLQIKDIDVTKLRKSEIIADILHRRSQFVFNKLSTCNDEYFTYFLLSRVFIFILLYCNGYSPVAVYNLFNKETFNNETNKDDNTIYKFYLDKYLIYIPKNLIKKFKIQDIIELQLSKLESDFLLKINASH